ncbi:putative serine/threonine protein kinase [Blattamonas nauphoetae]|uniref:Serine/threonine protein kinase n=1 Tax=Blattamonas nauphoetae TaxID=2049346 RepID=A0ABQ9WRY9_9EUKA|nr:putative serine/threonine protein kinase [Blattamonas nauphoetae]
MVDLSTNGTYLNKKKVGKNNEVVLRTGDQIDLLAPSLQKQLPVPLQYFFRLNHEACTQFVGEMSMGDKFIFQKYTLGDPLGKGNFGIVREGIVKETQMPVAVKIIDNVKMVGHSGTTDSTRILSEFHLMKQLDHPNIVKVFDGVPGSKSTYIVMELVRGGELFDIVSRNRLPEQHARHFFRQMLSAVLYMHQHEIVHRDLKPENIMLSGPFDLGVYPPTACVKITDFGVSRVVGKGTFIGTLCGTPEYFAPEMFGQVRKCTKALDMWSLGVILFIMLGGYPPFTSDTDARTRQPHLMQQITHGMYSFPDAYWKDISRDAINLIMRLMTVDPSKRITATEAAVHPWIVAGAGDGTTFSTNEKGPKAQTDTDDDLSSETLDPIQKDKHWVDEASQMPPPQHTTPLRSQNILSPSFDDENVISQQERIRSQDPFNDPQTGRVRQNPLRLQEHSEQIQQTTNSHPITPPISPSCTFISSQLSVTSI